MEVLRAESLAGLPWLVHGFSTRTGGFSAAYGGHALNLGYTPSDDRASVDKNRATFYAAVGGNEEWQAVGVNQIHSDLIYIVSADAETAGPLISPQGKLRRGDGLVTAEPGVLLTIRVADCVPVLLADPKQRIVAAFHAGWRGTVKRIVEKGVGSMRAFFGSDPRDLRVAIGPCIHQCCYAVGDEVLDAFESQFAYANELVREVYDSDPIKKKYPMLFLTARAPGHSPIGPQQHLDLVEANRRQLLDAGVAPEHITASELCTSCRTDLLFSHRAEAGYTGRMMAAIGVVAEPRQRSSRRR